MHDLSVICDEKMYPVCAKGYLNFTHTFYINSYNAAFSNYYNTIHIKKHDNFLSVVSKLNYKIPIEFAHNIELWKIGIWSVFCWHVVVFAEATSGKVFVAKIMGISIISTMVTIVQHFKDWVSFELTVLYFCD